MTTRFRLFAKRQLYVPTIFGWFCLLGCMATLLLLCVCHAYSFLAYQNPGNANVCIIEGWVPDDVLEQGLALFKEDDHRLFVTTGGPVELGYDLSQYKTYAELAAARLMRLGISEGRIVAVPNPKVERDRTYAAALEVRKWLLKNPSITSANLITKGAHARRSFLVFRKVLPPTFQLGVYAIPPSDYDPHRWWASSEGFRTVVSEGIAYTYARLVGPG